MVAEQGSALIIVLWTVLLLAFAVAMASARVALILEDTSIRSKRFQAELMADSAFSSIDYMIEQEKKRALDAKSDGKEVEQLLNLNRFQGAWRSQPVELENGRFWLELSDEQSKINWIKTPFFVWRNLLTDAGLSTEAIDKWEGALKDWQDGDELQAVVGGAETSDYQKLAEDKRHSKNAPISDVGELFWVMGGPDIMELTVTGDPNGKAVPLLPMTTIYGDGKININTAPATLISAALGVSLEDAEQQIVQFRRGPDGIEGTTDDVFLTGVPAGVLPDASKVRESVTARPGASTNIITTTTTIFRVRGVGESGNQRVVREALATKEGNSGLRLLNEPRTVAGYRVVEE